ncbi:flavin-containing monooxygenase [Peristeroidobacter soli]|uniref:flavin-containing monooxygenase n=1 Tax=Peristeroidobacter soli TaxID=2497877 RepID=UPI001C37B426|nr:NAD(P)/FAD-dependent oxidoreductase [Peristeroidobacter soli]
MSSSSENIGIDVDALERKYAEEREKRRRTDAMAQFQALQGRFADFAKDPHANPDFKRDALKEDVDVLIIGGGFAGLLAGGRLRERGVKRIRIVEKGADFGGTWYWNRYPGAACDVESYIYLPMLEELGYLPSQRYPNAPEIREHCHKLAERFDLYPSALFQTQVSSVQWDEQRGRWDVRTDRGDSISARFVVSCTGLLSNPKLPGIPGIEDFEGHAFHTSRWDYGYTGGDERGNMTGLANKRVGIIGTGSTGIQVIPQLAAAAGHLYVFQRTPSSVDVRNNGPTDPRLMETFQPGWQRERRDNFTALVGGEYVPVDLVQDSWTDIIRNVMPRLENGTPVADADAVKLAEMSKMEGVRRRVEAIVKDKATAEALKPYFHYFCKRPCFHDEYLEAFNRPNVSLIDTQGKGVERITARGVVVQGREYPLDCLIFATGFDFLTEYCREAGMEVTGPGAVTLSKHWEQGRRTLYGIMTRGFPNFFMVSIAQAGAAVNYVHIADEQTKTIVHMITEALRRDVATLQPTLEAQNEWVQQIADGAAARQAFLETCTPGYYNYEGQRPRHVALNDFYAPGPMAYIRVLDNWRQKADLAGLELSPAAG